MTEKQRKRMLGLLWDCLKRDPKYKDRRVTMWGTKTKVGLIACLERILTEHWSIKEDRKDEMFS